MIRGVTIFWLWLATSGAVLGETAMTGAQFDTYTRLKTLSYLENGTPYGAEQYLSRRRVKWSYGDGECVDGTWYEPEPGLICFQYETTDPAPQCWHFFQTATGLTARFVSAKSNTILYETDTSTDPLYCVGPKVGA